MNNSLTKKLGRVAQFVGGGLLLLTCNLGNTWAHENANEGYSHKAEAPHSLADMDMVLQIENTVSNLSSGFPNQGAVVRCFKNNGTWSEEKGIGGPFHQAANGSYHYQRTGFATGVEKSIDATANNAPATTTYTFEDHKSGKWVSNWDNGRIVFSGRFTMVPSNLPENQHLAPITNAGLHVALTIDNAVSTSFPPNTFPNRALVMQSYANNGTVVLLGFGANAINSRGTYTYKKLSANTAVEEAMQTSDFFTQPYTMVYTFKTATTGVWFQNFGNGLIRFSGTFQTFPR